MLIVIFLAAEQKCIKINIYPIKVTCLNASYAKCVRYASSNNIYWVRLHHVINEY